MKTLIALLLLNCNLINIPNSRTFSLQCDAGVGTNALYEQLYSAPTKLMVVGAGCSAVSQATAQASHIWNLVQVMTTSRFIHTERLRMQKEQSFLDA